MIIYQKKWLFYGSCRTSRQIIIHPFKILQTHFSIESHPTTTQPTTTPAEVLLPPTNVAHRRRRNPLHGGLAPRLQQTLVHPPLRKRYLLALLLLRLRLRSIAITKTASII